MQPCRNNEWVLCLAVLTLRWRSMPRLSPAAGPGIGRRRPQARLAADRGEPRGAGAGHFHRRFVGALPAVARQDRGASRDMAPRTVVGGQHRPLHSRSRSRLRPGCRVSDRGSAPVRGHQRRRDAMAAARSPALALGRPEFDDRRVQASRRAEEIRDLIGEAFLGWLVSDGYAVYRGYKRRQRCLAHLIRKGIALIEGYNYDAARFGDWLVRELRGLIHAVAEQDGARALNPILARLKRACLLNEDADAAKARALAREILNDWDAITAFVTNPDLPPTNNDAETALRHAVIARRISFGTRTEEGSRACAAILSVIETCRRRKIDAWGFITKTVGYARRGEPPATLPAPAFRDPHGMEVFRQS